MQCVHTKMTTRDSFLVLFTQVSVDVTARNTEMQVKGKSVPHPQQIEIAVTSYGLPEERTYLPKP